MYKSNTLTQAWVYLMITLAKQKVVVGKSDMIYDRPSETVPEQLLGLYVVVLYDYKAVRHIQDKICHFLDTLCTCLADLGQKNILFAYAMVGH